MHKRSKLYGLIIVSANSNKIVSSLPVFSQEVCAQHGKTDTTNACVRAREATIDIQYYCWNPGEILFRATATDGKASSFGRKLRDCGAGHSRMISSALEVSFGRLLIISHEK